MSVAHLQIAELHVERDAPLVRIDEIGGELAYGRRSLSVRSFAARLGDNRLTLAGQLDTRKPFAIDMGGTLISKTCRPGAASRPRRAG